VRTTPDLNDDLLAEAKAFAGWETLTLTRLIEEGLALRLRQGQRPSAAAQAFPATCSAPMAWSCCRAGPQRMPGGLRSGFHPPVACPSVGSAQPL